MNRKRLSGVRTTVGARIRNENKKRSGGRGGSPSLIVVAGAGNIKALDKSHQEICKRIVEKALKINPERINFRERKEKMVPKTLTDAMLLIFVNWNRVARNLSEKKIISNEEIFKEGNWIFQAKWMVEALKNEFPDLIYKFYEDKGNKGRVDFGRLRSSVTSIISQSLKSFETAGFMRHVANDTKPKPSRIYLISSNFSFKQLKKIYINRFEVKQD